MGLLEPVTLPGANTNRTKNSQPSIAPPEQAAQAMTIIDAIYQSAMTGQEVTFS